MFRQSPCLNTPRCSRRPHPGPRRQSGVPFSGRAVCRVALTAYGWAASRRRIAKRSRSAFGELSARLMISSSSSHCRRISATVSSMVSTKHLVERLTRPGIGGNGQVFWFVSRRTSSACGPLVAAPEPRSRCATASRAARGRRSRFLSPPAPLGSLGAGYRARTAAALPGAGSP